MATPFLSSKKRGALSIMGANDAEIWSATWRGSGGRPKPRWGFIFRRIVAHVPVRDQTILELGAGEGNLAYHALRAGARHVTLVDFSEEAFQRARQLLEPWPAAKKSFVCANLLDVDLGCRFDLVWSSGVVEHFAAAELERCIERHAAHSCRHVAVVAPSDTVFNRRRSRDPNCRAMFGFWQTIPDAVLADLVGRQGFDVKVCERFRRSYGVPLVPIRGTRRVQAWLHRIVFDFLLAPVLPARTGGLLLVVGERRAGV
ncbi:MAG: class I SAM-dependent methyltransferase [Candidatus Sumerlaeia bacterium]|nr:class I SAM-dependent methyltransferase [Candidatus Sumerlaeia bacterium]